MSRPSGGAVTSALAVAGFGLATWLWVFGPWPGWAIPVGVVAAVVYYFGNFAAARGVTGLLLLLLPVTYIATLLMGAGTTLLELVGETAECVVADREPYDGAGGSGVEVTVTCPDGQRYRFNEARAAVTVGETVSVTYDPSGRVDANLTRLQHDGVGVAFMAWTVVDAVALAGLPVWIRMRRAPARRVD